MKFSIKKKIIIKKKKIPACLIKILEIWPEKLFINFFWPNGKLRTLDKVYTNRELRTLYKVYTNRELRTLEKIYTNRELLTLDRQEGESPESGIFLLCGTPLLNVGGSEPIL